MSAKGARKTETASQTKMLGSGALKRAAKNRSSIASREERCVLSQETREQLIVENRNRGRKLARSILRRWHARLDLEEVDSIVDLSLCEAARLFNPEVGAGFMTFLFYHLRGNLIRAVTLAATAHTIPVADVASIGTIDAESEHWAKRGKTAINSIEIAGALVGSDILTPDEALDKKEMIEFSRQARMQLDDLEKLIVERVYLNEEQVLDLASELGYSRCHISRVKRKALEALYNGMATLAGADVIGPRRDADDDDDEDEDDVEVRRRAKARRPRSDRVQRAQLQALRVRL